MGIQAIIGIHIGQGQNHTAIAEVYFSGWSYTILRITRLPLEILYPEVGDALVARIRALTEDYDLKVRVNATGIGSPVTNLLRKKMIGCLDVYSVLSG